MQRSSLLLLFLFFAPSAQAEGVHPTLIYREPLAQGIAALPRLSATHPAFQTINTALAQQDDSTLSLAQNCLSEPNSDYSATSVVMLNGPEYLAILSGNEFYCNTAHPWTIQSVLLFDLNTGEAVAAASLLPPDLRPLPEYTDGQAFDETRELARVKPLTDLYLSRLAFAPPNDLAALNHDDCTDILQHDRHDFLIWPDAQARALILQPDGMAYVFSPCVAPVSIPLRLLRDLHFPARLIAALDQP